MRWPVILFCRISSLGETFDIFPFASLPKNPKIYIDCNSDVETLFLLPGDKGEAAVFRTLKKERQRLLSAPLALSAAKFLTKVRGLPLSELEIECEGDVFQIISNDGVCRIWLPAFSVCEIGKLKTFPSGEVKIGTVRTPIGKIRLIFSSSAQKFSLSALPSLTLSDEGEEIIGALAFSFSGDNIDTVSHFCISHGKADLLISAIAAASYANCLYPRTKRRVTVNGTVFDFLFSDGGFFVSDRHGRPLTLYAPEL